MINIENLHFSYDTPGTGKVTALKSVNLTIHEGENIGLIGANSSGKTTLVRCLNSLLVPSSGKITVDGLDTSEPQNSVNIRRKVGMVFQNPDNQIVSATVEREIAFGLENLGVPTEKMRTIVEKTLNTFDLIQYRTHPPYLLSGGEKQRLALAAVMAMEPKYLILDEPTSLLDPRGRDSIVDLIKAIHRKNKNKEVTSRVTTVFITQYPEEMLSVDRLLVMNQGIIIMDDDPEIIFNRLDELQKIGLQAPVEFELDKLFKKYDIK